MSTFSLLMVFLSHSDEPLLLRRPLAFLPATSILDVSLLFYDSISQDHFRRGHGSACHKHSLRV